MTEVPNGWPVVLARRVSELERKELQIFIPCGYVVNVRREERERQ